MSHKKIKVGIAGTHSTGKSTFLERLNSRLTENSLRTGHVGDLAKAARDRGFPILTEHNFESTLWIMAEGMRQEAEAALTSDVILVDRPVFDALGYLYAALEISGRSLPDRKLEELRLIAGAHAADYDLLILTELDPAIRLGEGRDGNQDFRVAAAEHIRRIAEGETLAPVILTSRNTDMVLEEIYEKTIGLLA
ncbi:AAA family ATPase [Rhizobium leguminosarum]|uniref:AAA family ATPase n=1 Tax=Rhizobium leguminosarum TaxID=384 RepID=UPI001C947AF2|nr:AAA family ATPase [Rhizobium leguminosarum]MBY5361897.1 AAA family ATPase [Rhizobium leguminosarum]MBY5664927.1 AAA family ATPase [Rhizobium leguminosarum]MBY5677589.1 AAA family ATPase [Rhizobium leguminosarum]